MRRIIAESVIVIVAGITLYVVGLHSPHNPDTL
jgi:hypothetical protein